MSLPCADLGRQSITKSQRDSSIQTRYLAAKAAGREKAIIFIGIDGLPQEGPVYVREGLLEASFEYPTGGREAVESAVQIIHGQKVPRLVTLKSHVFTKETVTQGGEWLP